MCIHLQKAFSLLEMLVVIVLIGLMSLFVLPDLSLLIQKNQHDKVRHELHSSLNNARMQAILNRKIVELCAPGSTTTCAQRWENGWQSHFIETPQTPFAINQYSQPITLHWSGFSQSIRFYANGTSPFSNGRFIHCRAGMVSWQLVINRQGRIREGSTAENLAQQQRCEM